MTGSMGTFGKFVLMAVITSIIVVFIVSQSVSSMGKVKSLVARPCLFRSPTKRIASIGPELSFSSFAASDKTRSSVL